MVSQEASGVSIYLWFSFSDRISTKRTTGFTPYKNIFGQLPDCPVDLEMDTYLGIDWLAISTTEEILEAWTKQLERKDEILEEAHQKLLMKARENSKRYWDREMAAQLRNPLDPGDLVLVYKKSLEDQWGKLFSNRWNGPFRIKEQLPKGSYLLKELDGTELKRTYAASHIKRFFPRGWTLQEISQEELDPDEESLKDQPEEDEDNEAMD